MATVSFYINNGKPAAYHSSQEAYLYDLHRQKILEGHGFVFHRIWSTNWWRNPNREAKNLVEFIRKVENAEPIKVEDEATIKSAFSDSIAIETKGWLFESHKIQKELAETERLSLMSAISYSAIFGSVARGSNAPNDCDLLIVSDVLPLKQEWHNLKIQIPIIQSHFLMEFDIVLSVVLLTINEWQENKHFFHDRIDIYGSP